MAIRKDVTAILTEIASTLADNTSQAITPALLRTVVKDITDCFAPSGARLLITNPATVNMGLTGADQIVTFLSSATGGSPQYSVGSLQTLTSDQKSANRVGLTMQVGGPDGIRVTATVYMNGVATDLAGGTATAGNGIPTVISMSGVIYADPGASFSLRLKASNNGTFNITSTSFHVENVPVYDFTNGV
jgi:hypothetical protein